MLVNNSDVRPADAPGYIHRNTGYRRPQRPVDCGYPCDRIRDTCHAGGFDRQDNTGIVAFRSCRSRSILYSSSFPFDAPGSGRLRNWRQPAEQEEMMAAKGASIREEKPVQRLFYGVSDADASKIDGSAMRAAGMKHDSGNLVRNAACRRNRAISINRRSIGRAARLAGGLDLFRGPDVGLRHARVDSCP